MGTYAAAALQIDLSRLGRIWTDHMTDDGLYPDRGLQPEYISFTAKIALGERRMH